MSTNHDLYHELESRGMIFDATEGVRDLVRSEKIAAYIGFDPTASSLHVGSLLPVMALVHLQRHGHTPIAIVGGGTGMIGDPSGKSAERQFLTPERVAENLQGIRSQLERFLSFEGENAAQLVDNGTWLSPLSLLQFLRDVGKYFSVNYMLRKDSVRRRVESEGEGISFTEFSYMLLQAYDFLMLYDDRGCVLQMGGSDQWGNITAGIELIRRLRGKAAHGLVLPLLTTAAGTKFGKTEAGTIWLDAERTSPYRFYQFWLNADDRDVGRYLAYFTLLPLDRIRQEVEAHEREPGRRHAQRLLAREVTALVHGEDEARRAERASSLLFGGDVQGLTAAEILDVFSEVPSSTVDPDGREGDTLLSDLVIQAGFAPSRAAARRLIAAGGVYVNGRAIPHDAPISREHGIEGTVVVLRKGKRDYHLIRYDGE